MVRCSSLHESSAFGVLLSTRKPHGGFSVVVMNFITSFGVN